MEMIIAKVFRILPLICLGYLCQALDMVSQDQNEMTCPPLTDDRGLLLQPRMLVFFNKALSADE